MSKGLGAAAAAIIIAMVPAAALAQNGVEGEIRERAYLLGMMNSMDNAQQASLWAMLQIYNESCAPIGPTAAMVSTQQAALLGPTLMIPATDRMREAMHRTGTDAWCANFRDTVDGIRDASKPVGH